jgi:hypothetical protein
MYPHSVLARGAYLFNGRYAIAGPHPGSDTQYTASSPDLLTKTRVGSVFNAKVHNRALKADIWLDKERCGLVAPELLMGVQNGKTLECSTGLWTEVDPDLNGEYRGKRFDATVLNIRGADHVAIFLNGMVGACSVADGCGVNR